MLEHHQSHTDNYRFRCSICNKGFTRQSYFRDHKCPSAGNGTGTKGATGNAEAEEGEEAQMLENDVEDNERRITFTRNVESPGSAGDDREDDDNSNDSRKLMQTSGEEGEEERTDRSCQASLSITATRGQTDRAEDRMEHGGEVLEQRQGDDANCLRPPCL